VKIIEDKFLSNIFEYSCYNLVVEVGDIFVPSITFILNTILLSNDREKKFIYTTIGKDTSIHTYSLLSLGFEVITENIVYRINRVNSHLYYTALKDVQSGSCEDLLIVGHSYQDEVDVLEIAFTSFIYDRFHADKNIDIIKANSIKGHWVANCLNGERGDSLFVSRRNGKVVGFLIALKKLVDDKIVGVIDLIATNFNYRGQGVGKELINTFLYNYVYQCDYVIVGTQSKNIVSRSLYLSKGFCESELTYSMHLHL